MNPAVKVIIPAVTFSVVKGSASSCSRCHREAVLVQAYSGRALCREHLVRDIERRARREVRRQGGLRPGDRVAILSGDRPAQIALRFFLEQRVVGGRVPVLSMNSTPGSPAEVKAAREGCSVFADASTLEDAAARVLSAVLSGRSLELLAHPLPGAARVIRPFARVPAEEIGLYASWMGGMPSGSSIPEGDPFALLVMDELRRHTDRHPSAPFALARLEDTLLDLEKEDEG